MIAAKGAVNYTNHTSAPGALPMWRPWPAPTMPGILIALHLFASAPSPMDPRALFLSLCLLPFTLAAQSVPESGIPEESSPRLDPLRAERGYVGAGVCGECHQKELELWKGSDHDLAMMAATAETVLGDFEDAELVAHGVTSRFFRRDSRFFVRTDGPDGELRDYPIAYTFGWYPLQQYLIELPGGRLQSLGLAWDSRTTERGGQRWFHLYP
jgi:hypothetical protein